MDFLFSSESMVRWLTENMDGLPKELIITIISMLPILELRGGLVAAALLGVPMWKAVFFCVLGNVIPIPFILLFIEKILNWMKTVKYFKKIALWLEARATGEKSKQIRKYEFIGTMLFVGIPLPGTGAWTGSLIVSLLHVDRKKASLAIACGVAMACVIMCILTYAIPGFFGF